MQLTTNFELSEFINSDIAKKEGINNAPTGGVICNLQLLCKNLLQPLRDLYKKPLFISSGYRCPQLNKLVGGVATSDHLKGCAADVKCNDINELLTTLITSRLSFDQAILYPTFLHLSYRDKKNRKMIIRK